MAGGSTAWGDSQDRRGPPNSTPSSPARTPRGSAQLSPPLCTTPFPPPKQKAQGRERVALTPSGAAAGTYLCRTVEPAARGATALLGERPEEPTLVALGLGPGCGERREPGAGEGRRTQPGERGRPSRHPPHPGQNLTMAAATVARGVLTAPHTLRPRPCPQQAPPPRRASRGPYRLSGILPEQHGFFSLPHPPSAAAYPSDPTSPDASAALASSPAAGPGRPSREDVGRGAGQRPGRPAGGKARKEG